MLQFKSTTVGHIGIEAVDGRITRLYLPGETGKGRYPQHKTAEPILKEAFAQIDAYLAGRLKAFDLPLDTGGTAFQRKVWDALCAIPYGEAASYADIARVVGCPKGPRAVGMANHANPIALIIPCHRVIATGGGLGGYGGGLPLKRKLLKLEGIHFSEKN